MAGLNPTTEGAIASNILSQVSAADPEPITRTILGIGASIASIFGAHHSAAVKREAQTLSSAVPAWRQLLQATVEAYNSGEIDAAQAVDYVEQAKSLYYQQVQPIERGKPQPGGAPDYYAAHGRFAPIDPCNAACNIAYYGIEPEALLVENAFKSGKAVTVNLLPFTVLNTGGQGGVTAQQLVIQPPVLETVLPSGVYAQLPDVVKHNPLIFAALAVFAGVVLLKK